MTMFSVKSKKRSLRIIWAIALAFVLVFTIAPARAMAYVFDQDQVGEVILSSVQDSPIADDAPDIEATNAILITSDGEVLWQRGADTTVSIASTTKIMTAIVALEQGSLGQLITVSREAVDVEGSSAGLCAGDVLTLQDLLYGLLLSSGNDAANAIAEYYGDEQALSLGEDSTDAFIDLMNSKAEQLGMTSTHFSNPSGVVDEDNYSTAADFAKLVVYAMSNETFREIVSTSEYSCYSTVTGDLLVFENTNPLIASGYEGANGVKTGYTDSAGYCLIGSANRDNIELYAIVFGSTSIYQRGIDAQVLLDWGFAHYHEVTLLTSQTQVGYGVATSWLDKTFPVIVAQDVTAVVFDYWDDLTVEVEIIDKSGTIEQGSEVGEIRWLHGEEIVASAPLVANQTINGPNILQQIQIWWLNLTAFFTGDTFSAEQVIEISDTYALLSSQM